MIQGVDAHFTHAVAYLAVVLIGLLFAVYQAKYGRIFGPLKSFAGAAILVGAAWIVWSIFPSIEVLAGQKYLVAPAANAAVSTILITLWFWVVFWLLRKI